MIQVIVISITAKIEKAKKIWLNCKYHSTSVFVEMSFPADIALIFNFKSIIPFTVCFISVHTCVCMHIFNHALKRIPASF